MLQELKFQLSTAILTVLTIAAATAAVLNYQQNQVFRVFIETLAQKYEKGGGVRLSKQASSPAGPPSGS